MLMINLFADFIKLAFNFNMIRPSMKYAVYKPSEWNETKHFTSEQTKI